MLDKGDRLAVMKKNCRCQMPDTSSSAVTLFIGNVRNKYGNDTDAFNYRL